MVHYFKSISDLKRKVQFPYSELDESPTLSALQIIWICLASVFSTVGDAKNVPGCTMLARTPE